MKLYSYQYVTAAHTGGANASDRYQILTDLDDQAWSLVFSTIIGLNVLIESPNLSNITFYKHKYFLKKVMLRLIHTAKAWSVYAICFINIYFLGLAK